MERATHLGIVRARDMRMSVRVMSDELSKCKRRLAELEDENAELRASSQAFGDLAERLNQALQLERRSGTERRVSVRPSPDRREPTRSESGGGGQAIR